MVVTMMPYIAHADVEGVSVPEIINSGECGDDTFWALDSEGNLTISGIGAIDGFDRTVKKTLKASTVNITINEGVTSIEDWAFDGFNQLTNITFSPDMEYIGYGAFYGCSSLISVDIPDKVTVVEDWAFTNCSNLENVEMKDSVTYLGECAFNSCGKLSHVILSKNLTEIKDSTFVGCKSLDNIIIPQNITVIGDYAFRNCTSLKEVIIPSGVTTIGDYAFDKCIGLNSIIIPKTVTTIGNSAVVFSDNITVFGPPDSTAQQYAQSNNCQFYYLEHLQCISDGQEVESIVLEKAGFNSSGIRQVSCQRCGSISELVISAAKPPVLSTQSYTFDNKTKTPRVTVYDGSFSTIPSYAAYSSGRRNVGKYAVSVTLNNSEYSGKTTSYFVINPRGVSISKLYRYREAIKVRWKRPSKTYRKQMSGYQIRYSTSSKMWQSKLVTVKSTKTTSKKIKRLKARKYYYVQIRTYKTLKGIRYYSGWSRIKKIKTR